MKTVDEIKAEILRVEVDIEKFNAKGELDLVRSLAARKWALKWVLEEEL